jgi:opacity protein-like surface antigen
VGRVDADIELATGLGGPGYAGYGFIDDADWGFAFQLGAGVAFDIMSNMAIDVGYRYKIYSPDHWY